MEVHTDELPGIGQRFEIELQDDLQIIVVIHKTGQREVFRRSSSEQDAEELLELTDEQARLLGSILIGGFYQPSASKTAKATTGENTTIEWQTLREPSNLIGQSIEQAAVRDRTGVTIVAVQRGDDVISNPNPEFTFNPGDVLVTIGTLEQQNQLETLLTD
jgi:TrkA domain protein